jgi:hypothetical protein
VARFEPIDVYAPAAPGSLMRAHRIEAPGLWRLARRSCELYSVQIASAGAWGRARVYDATGAGKWYQPSTFTGSFWLGAGCIDGLLVELDARDTAPALVINWREPTRDLV